ncbi:MAG: T9SS type A sorting domain-containing protein [Chitinophagales bacterium]|nr:T9SS type A sorting domain-containing protein [Chitinophagales bacterium]
MKNLILIATLLPWQECCFAQAAPWQNVGDYHFNEPIYVLYIDSATDQLLIAGQFRVITNGDTIYHIASWNGSKLDSLGSGINNYSGSLYLNIPNLQAICRYHNKLYVGGAFSKIGSIEQFFLYLATWDGTSWDTVSKRFNSAVLDMKVFNDTLYACGSFDSVGNMQVNGLVGFDGIDWFSLGVPNQDPNANDDNVVRSLQFYQGDLYLTGYFYDSTNHQHQIIRRHNGTWEFMPEEFDLKGGSDWSNAMCIYDDKLILSGYFLKQWGNADNNIMAWDGTQWHAMGGGMGCSSNPSIWDIFVYQGKLYAVGAFNCAGEDELPADNIAVWDGSKWCGFAGGFNNKALGAAIYHDTLYIAGGFTQIDDDSIYYIAMLTAGMTGDTCGYSVGISENYPTLICFSFNPNPSSNEMEVTTSAYGHLTITNELGELIHSFTVQNKQLKVSTSNFPSGTYFLTFQTDTTIQTKKIIIQH